MVDIKNLDEAEKVFLHEFEIYNEFSNFIDANPIEKNEVKDFANSYLNLLNQAVKLVKISDNTQLKLRNAQAILKKQNVQIEEQNENLTIANENQERLLGIINKELAKAANYVKSILPKPLKDSSSELKIDWKFIPSSKLGGDLFGYKKLDGHNIALYLLDVCGHGVQSALYSVSVVNTINYFNLPNTNFNSPKSVFKSLNKMFDMKNHNNLFFTMWYGVYNCSTREMVYASAGHPPAILLKNDGSSELLECDNLFIGGLDFEFVEKTCRLDSRDKLFLYSDGAYEIPLNEKDYWTIEELATYLSENNDDDNILDKLYQHINDISFEDSLDDDFSIMRILIK
ncbi:MAG: serine/threonine-protein phosphatase [Candidatus Kapabacteria bacterium]|nr:serine/threonine-protein phosphatase [Ignavibacteriota bacterium]MCW5884603.1 serine/threonine-protein phosphatase [Candidatus Kapabacteria bacterium]